MRYDMKKFGFLLLAILAACTMLTACGSGAVRASGLLSDICQLFPDLPATESVYQSDTESGGELLSEQDAAHIYKGEYGALPEWSLVEEYAVRLPDQPQIYEIHILKVKDETNLETISKLLCHRADLLAKYFNDPSKTGDYDYSGYRADVYQKGQYVFLIATPNNDSVIALIDKSV